MGFLHDEDVVGPFDILETNMDFGIIADSGGADLPAFDIAEYCFGCGASQFVLAAKE